MVDVLTFQYLQQSIFLSDDSFFFSFVTLVDYFWAIDR